MITAVDQRLASIAANERQRRSAFVDASAPDAQRLQVAARHLRQTESVYGASYYEMEGLDSKPYVPTKK